MENDDLIRQVAISIVGIAASEFGLWVSYLGVMNAIERDRQRRDHLNKHD